MFSFEVSIKPDRRSFLNRTSPLAGGAFSAQSIFNQGPSDYRWRFLDRGREPESLKKGMILVGTVLPPA